VLVLVAAALGLPAGCAVSMRKKLPGMAVPPETVISKLERLTGELRTNKQIFRVRLFDKGRTFSGDGALCYRAPDTLQLSIYGPPFSTLWMQVLTRGDSILLVLPKDNRVVHASRDDPHPVSRLAGSESLTDAEFLGGVTGIFHLERFLMPGMQQTAAAEGEVERLRFFNDSVAYEFVYSSKLNAVVHFIHYRDGRKHREIMRSEFKQIGGMQRAGKTVYRDYFEDREITVLVGKEEVNPELAEGAFELLLPDGT